MALQDDPAEMDNMATTLDNMRTDTDLITKFVRGLLSYRRMVKKKDLGKVFFIYLCLVSVCPAHPCGDNPLRGFVSLSRLTGKNVNHLLSVLRSADGSLYRQLERNWEVYANCVGMVDTGYFKRSGGAPAKRDGKTYHDDGLLPFSLLSDNFLFFDGNDSDGDDLL